MAPLECRRLVGQYNPASPYSPDSQVATITYPKGTGEQDKMTYNGADQEMKITMVNGTKIIAGISYLRSWHTSSPALMD